MRVSVQVIDDCVYFKIAGQFYIESAPELKEKAFEYLKRGFTKFSFDLSALDYIDSSGLGVLIVLHKQVLPDGGRVVIKGAKGSVAELFHMTRLDRIFKMEDNNETPD